MIGSCTHPTRIPPRASLVWSLRAVLAPGTTQGMLAREVRRGGIIRTNMRARHAANLGPRRRSPACFLFLFFIGGGGTQVASSRTLGPAFWAPCVMRGTNPGRASGMRGVPTGSGQGSTRFPSRFLTSAVGGGGPLSYPRFSGRSRTESSSFVSGSSTSRVEPVCCRVLSFVVVGTSARPGVVAWLVGYAFWYREVGLSTPTPASTGRDH